MARQWAHPVHGNTGDIKKTISIAILLCGNPSQSTVDKFGSYDNMFRHVFTEALATIPRHEWHPKISLYIRSFNVTLGEFPDVSQLDDGLWDAVVVTGTRMSILPKKKLTGSRLLHERNCALDGCAAQIPGAPGHGAPLDPCDWHLLWSSNRGPSFRRKGSAGQDQCRGTFDTLCAQSSILTFLQFGVVPISLTSDGTELLSPFDDRTTWVRMFCVHISGRVDLSLMDMFAHAHDI